MFEISFYFQIFDNDGDGMLSYQVSFIDIKRLSSNCEV